MLLSIENLHKEFKIGGERKSVISGLSCSLDRGQIISITGRSGCGKTTLFNVISGLESPDGGTIHFDGKKVRHKIDFYMSGFRCRKIGFIFQTFNILEKESVLANVLLPARINGKVNKGVKDNVLDIMGRLRIFRYRNMKAGVLSGGQKQRVAIARALVNDPPIILADEPTANLDKGTSIEIFKILEDLREEGRGVLIITHKDYMHGISDRVHLMEGGRFSNI